MKPKSIFDMDAEKREEEQKLLKEQIVAKTNNEQPAASSDPVSAASEVKKDSFGRVRRKKLSRERMNITLSAEAREKLVSVAEHDNVTMSSIIEDLIYKYL